MQLVAESEPFQTIDVFEMVSFNFETTLIQGAIGFDWVTAGWGGVPWLVSWPR